jgi:hypothetical protein
MKYISLIPHSVEKFRKDFVREHSKFIHSSYLLETDIDKQVTIGDRNFTIAGLWDTHGYNKEILLHYKGSSYAHCDSKVVANALGFTKFRNFVTGKEITYDISAIYAYNQMMSRTKVEDTGHDTNTNEDNTAEYVATPPEEIDAPIHARDNEYVNEDGEETEEDVDPLVRALRQTEDDGGWIEESEEN